jgi:murein DD-endopeptidase MepM/ murein hydrolase activator NlpD
LTVNAGVAPYITTGYGDYETHEDAFHNDYFAVDFYTGGGSFPVIAAAEGTGRLTREAGSTDDWGIGIFIRHDENWQTKYLHLHPDCGLIVDKETAGEFEVEAGAVIGWTKDSLKTSPHLHFALRGGSTSNFSSFATPLCCGNHNCNWSYPIPEVAPDLAVPEWTYEPCADNPTCPTIADRHARAKSCCAPAIVPGGVWESVVLDGDTLRMTAHAYPTNEDDPAISRVAFTMYWPGYESPNGGWYVACNAYRPINGDLYACDVDLAAIGAAHGEISISFDVYDVDGNRNLAPNGVKTITWVDDGCPGEQIRCGNRCVDPKRSHDHCGRCNNRCGIFGICCQGVCGCDGEVIIPGYCWNAEVICYPSTW